METNNRLLKKVLRSFPYIIIFAGIFVFFTQAHPLLVFDTDDWWYIYRHRHGIPLIGDWNPTKVLPETLMPIAAEIGVRIIMPLNGDYISSLSIAFALVLSLFIVVYFMSFGWFSKKKLTMKSVPLSFVLILFVLYHFWPFTNGTWDSRYYLFWAHNVTCIFNYTIPVLLNAALTIYLMTEKETICNASYIKKGFILLGIYLCINSNMFASIILSAWAGSELLESIYKNIGKLRINKIQEKDSIKSCMIKIVTTKENLFCAAIVVLWLAEILIEYKGGRAAAVGSGISMSLILESAGAFAHSVMTIRTLFLLSIGLFLLTGVMVSTWGGKYNNIIFESYNTYISSLVKSVICMFLTAIYLILLSAVAGTRYISRPDVLFTWLFWLMFIGFMSLGQICVCIPRSIMALPLMIYIIVFETIISTKTYSEINTSGYAPATVKLIDDFIINQVKEADKAALNDMTIYVPEYDTTDNWPIAAYGANRITSALYQHGIVSRYIHATIVPDKTVNSELKIP